jgi:tRNA(adenine34) deaminase
MRLALGQAQLASAAGEVPVGAVLVSGAGEVLASAHNLTEGGADPTAHAEMLCLRRAAGAGAGWRLLESTLYVTLEPCPRCAGAALQARVGALVYGARNPLLGADGSWVSLLPPQEGAVEEPPRRPHPFHPDMRVRRGVLEGECGEVMRAFFRRRRQEARDTAAAAAA